MKTALALGTFDGIHLAHRFVLDLPEGYKKTAVTFVKPPKMYIKNKTELLMTFSDKEKSLKEMGFSEIVALDFEEIKDLEPLDFLNYLCDNYNPAVISCGFNYRFGKDGMGDTELLQDFCDKNGICLKICDAIKKDGVVVSSTLIRNLLKQGEISEVNALMKNPFFFEAEVLQGDKRGRTIGFPTINQKYPEDLVKVKFGVYKTKVIADGKAYDGITNIGLRPTFESEYIISETFIKDFSGDLYGKTVKIVLEEFIRPEVKFGSLEELKQQIEKDINYIK
jgi:riboflavin kinase/FMN adenylyltransferase